MLRIHQIRCSPDETFGKQQIAKKLRCAPAEILSYEIERESLDARKDELCYMYSVLAEVRNEARYLKRKDVSPGTRDVYLLPDAPVNSIQSIHNKSSLIHHFCANSG